MGKLHERIDSKLARWLLEQPMFVVATAPLAADGMVNASPKGGAGTFAVLGERTAAYLDLTGSGVETIAHLRENGRIVMMFMSFDAAPRIVRLHGTGRVVLPGDAGFDALAGRFPHHPGTRAIIVVDIARIADSCGWTVPRMDLVADRSALLDTWSEKRGPAGLAAYRAERNTASIDGLPALDVR
jgi:hypothetical protein